MSRTIRCATAFLLLASAATNASVHIGKQGTVWPVIEPDIRQVMASQLANNHQFKTQQEKLKKETEGALDNQPGIALPVNKKTEVASFTPSHTLPRDKYYLKPQKDGSYQWEILYRKGTKVYPLRAIHLTEWLFIFDATHNDQIQLAKDMVEEAKAKKISLKLIATRGNLRKAMTTTGQIVFLLPPAFLKTVPIKSVPVMVGERDKVNDHLTIAMQAPPYSANKLTDMALKESVQ